MRTTVMPVLLQRQTDILIFIGHQHCLDKTSVARLHRIFFPVRIFEPSVLFWIDFTTGPMCLFGYVV